MTTWRLVYFTLDAPEDANFADYEDKELLKKHIEDALEDSHIVLITQISEPKILPPLVKGTEK